MSLRQEMRNFCDRMRCTARLVAASAPNAAADPRRLRCKAVHLVAGSGKFAVPATPHLSIQREGKEVNCTRLRHPMVAKPGVSTGEPKFRQHIRESSTQKRLAIILRFLRRSPTMRAAMLTRRYCEDFAPQIAVQRNTKRS